MNVIGSLISSLETGMIQLLLQSHLDEFIINNIIIIDNNNNPHLVKVSIGLLGDIISHCFNYIINIIPKVLPKIIDYIRVDYLDNIYFCICNNSIWVISELILKYKEQFIPFISFLYIIIYNISLILICCKLNLL